METLGAELAAPPKFLDPMMLDEVPSAHSALGESTSHNWEEGPLLAGVEERANAILDAAVERAHRTTNRFPRSARAYTNLGFALLNRGHLEEAAKEFERAVELDPRYVHAVHGLTQVRLSQGRLEEARAAFTELAESRPTERSVVMGLATLALRRGDIEEAIRLLERAVELAPESAIPRYHLGMALASLGRIQEAIAELREAINVNPRLAVLHVGLGHAYAKGGDRKRALREYRVALALVPGAIEAIYGLARVLVDEGDLSAAISTLDDLLGNDPSDNEARDLRAWAYFKSGDYKRCRQDLHQVIAAIDPSNREEMAHQAQLLNNLGACYWSLGNWDDAKRQFARSIDLDSATPAPYHNLGRLLLIEQQPAAAVTVLRQCRDRFPSDTPSGLLLVRALDMLDRAEEAIEELRGWVGDGNAPSEVWAVLGYYLTDRKREPSLAVAVLREALERFPRDPAVTNNLAYAYLMLGDVGEAREVLEALHKRGNRQNLSESTAVVHATWGLLRLREGDSTGAEEGYRKAEEIALRQGDSALAAAVRRKRHLEFARMLLADGNVEAARSEIRLGLTVAGDDPHRYRQELKELSASLKTANPNLNVTDQQEPDLV